MLFGKLYVYTVDSHLVDHTVYSKDEVMWKSTCNDSYSRKDISDFKSTIEFVLAMGLVLMIWKYGIVFQDAK